MRSWIDEDYRVYVAVGPGEDATYGQVIDLMNKAIEDGDGEQQVGVGDMFYRSDAFFVTDETLEKERWEESDMLAITLDLRKTHNLIVRIDIEEATGA